MTFRQMFRRVVLWGALALTLAASMWTNHQRSLSEKEDRVVLPLDGEMRIVESTALGFESEASVTAGQGAVVRSVSINVHSGVDPFAVRNWAPPPSPPLPTTAATPPPSEPTVPPLPFTFVGRQEQADGRKPAVFFLSRGTSLFAVVAGESLGEDYRFDGFEQGVLRFTYLPLSTRQDLNPGLNP